MLSEVGGKRESVMIRENYIEKLIEENDALIYYLARKYEKSLYMYEIEDLVQGIKLSLCEALPKFDFDQSKAKVTSYMHVVGENYLKRVVRYEQAEKRKVKSIQYLESNLVSESQGTYETVIEDKSIKAMEIENRIAIIEIKELIFSHLTEEDRVIYQMNIEGMKPREIAAVLGRDTKSIHNKLFYIKKSLKAKFSEDDNLLSLLKAILQK